MNGVDCKRKGDMYHFTFDTYTTMVGYLNMKRPSQVSICFDGEALTASIPVSAYTVRPPMEKKDG